MTTIPRPVGAPRLPVACRRTADALREWLSEALSPARVRWSDPLGYSLLVDGLSAAAERWRSGEGLAVADAAERLRALRLRTAAALGRRETTPEASVWEGLFSALSGRRVTPPEPLPPAPVEVEALPTVATMTRRMRAGQSPYAEGYPCRAVGCSRPRLWSGHGKGGRMEYLLQTCGEKRCIRSIGTVSRRAREAKEDL